MQPPISPPKKRLSKWVKIMTIVAASIGVPAFICSISEESRKYMGFKYDSAVHAVLYAFHKLFEPPPRPVTHKDSNTIVKGPKVPKKSRRRTYRAANSPKNSFTLPIASKPLVAPRDTQKAISKPSVPVITADDVLHMKAKAIRVRSNIMHPLEEVYENAAHEGDILFRAGEKHYESEEYKEAYTAYKRAHSWYCTALYKTD